MDSALPTSDALTKRLLITVHGIRTRGAWQKELNAAAGVSFIHEPLDYGYFMAPNLLRPKNRLAQVEWFLKEYTRLCKKHDDQRPCVIAHSLGSYIVVRAMEIYPEIAFDRIILCGAIVRTDFPWSDYNDSRFNRVLNDSGSADFWARIVRWGVEDSGPSGVEGFTDNANGRVVQRTHSEFGHSTHFYDLNYERNWIPFLNGVDPPPLTETASRPAKNWRYRIVTGALGLSAVSAAGYVGLRLIARNDAATSPTAENEGGKSKEGLKETSLHKKLEEERKSRAGLSEPTFKMQRMPFEQDQFPAKLREAKSAPGSKWSTFCTDFTPCEVTGWTFAYQSELVVEKIDEASGIAGIMVTLGDPPIRATCFLPTGQKSARYRQLDKGSKLTLVRGILEHIKPDGSLRFGDCEFNP